MKTVKEVFLHIADVYERSENYDEVLDNGGNEFICAFFICLKRQDLISESLWDESLKVFLANKPKDGDGSEYWTGDNAWWDTGQARKDGKESEMFNTKAKLLRKISETL